MTSDGRIKILDFGVAKLQSSPEESGRPVEELTTVTKSGAVIGTVAYMSPEQLRGKSVDHRSDIFSVGAILYEMLTGRRAFRGETEVDTITAVLRENPPEIDLEQSRNSLPVSADRPSLSGERAGESFSIGAGSGIRARNARESIRRPISAVSVNRASPEHRFPSPGHWPALLLVAMLAGC